MKAYHINSTERVVRQIDYQEGDLQKLVGGWIELAFRWPSGDVLYVDEEGLLKDLRYGFLIPERPDQPLAGNGSLVEKEIDETGKTGPPKMTLRDLTARVRFVEFR